MRSVLRNNQQNAFYRQIWYKIIKPFRLHAREKVEKKKKLRKEKMAQQQVAMCINIDTLQS